MHTYTRAEEYVDRLLKKHFINHPEQLTINNISSRLNIGVVYWEFGSESVRNKGKEIIFLQRKQTPEEQWEEFVHELSHCLWHVGRQEFMNRSFLDLQEEQAKYFTLHLCIPTRMLLKIKDLSISNIMRTFNVTQGLAAKRLLLFKNNYQEVHYEHYLI
ncbi:terminase [Oceanobacillus picturae]|uniref:Terminase n=1 Tax=Oceanobacillus picturae TaxID=171693 RepID=A0A0U9HZE5_9BACI|nr:ImmA/IrrE family metallo-endopeptidase [Oceanobacillus picturae]GAQ17981.1 terminase [Oceanobacillus picturae]